jgi:hypothetical protein
LVRTFVLAKRQQQHEAALAEQKQRHEETLTDQQLHRQYSLEFATERLARQLLQSYNLRPFALIKAYFGGFEDDELRRILVRAGAIRFESKSGEMWALMTRVPSEWLDRGLTKIDLDPGPGIPVSKLIHDKPGKPS